MNHDPFLCITTCKSHCWDFNIWSLEEQVGHSEQQSHQLQRKLSKFGAEGSLSCFHPEKDNYDYMELNLLG